MSRYDPEMIKDSMSKLSLFVVGFGRASSKEGRVAMLIGDLDIYRFIVYMQQVKEEKLKDREEYRNNKVKTGMSLDNKKVVGVDNTFRNKRGCTIIF